jgi:hypothetical protein
MEEREQQRRAGMHHGMRERVATQSDDAARRPSKRDAYPTLLPGGALLRQLQRSAGNRAVSRLEAQQQAAPAAAESGQGLVALTPGVALLRQLQRSAGNRAVSRLIETQQQAAQAAAESGQGLVALKPTTQTAQLLRPLTPKELAKALYGDDAHWSHFVLGPNRAELEGASADKPIAAGTEVRVLPELLSEHHRRVFGVVADMQERAREAGSEPYIRPRVRGHVVPGNHVRYDMRLPGLFNEAWVEWWVENDPLAVRDKKLPPRTEGPHAYIQGTGRQRVDLSNPVWFLDQEFEHPGTYQVKCRVKWAGNERELSYSQTVIGAAEQAEVAGASEAEGRIPKDKLLEELRRRRDELLKGDDTYAYRSLRDRVEQMEKAALPDMRPVRAFYVSESKQAATLPLTLYIGLDPDEAGRVDPLFHFKVWDYTPGLPQRNYTGSHRNADAAVRAALQGFADDAPYPKGRIRFDVEPQSFDWQTGSIGYRAEIAKQVVSYPTDGGWLLDDVLRIAGFVSLGAGVAAGLAGQGEIALPLIKLSGWLAAGAAAVSIADRLQHGDFEWDATTGTEMLDLAAALLSGGLSATAATVADVGKVTLTQRLKIGVETAQLAITTGKHSMTVSAAVQSGDKDAVANALGEALKEGALMLVVHEATQAAETSLKPKEPVPPAVKNEAVKLMEQAAPAPPKAKKGKQTATPEQALQVRMVLYYYHRSSNEELLAREAALGGDPLATRLLDMRLGGKGRPFLANQPGDAALPAKLEADLKAFRMEVEAWRKAGIDEGVLAPPKQKTSGPQIPSLKAVMGEAGTIGNAATDIPGLEGQVWRNGSPQAFGTADPTYKPSSKHPAAQGHAEQNLAGEIKRDLLALGADGLAAAKGKTVYIHVDQAVCSSCAAGIGDGARAGVLVQLSKDFPDITFEVSAADSRRILRFRDGKLN